MQVFKHHNTWYLACEGLKEQPPCREDTLAVGDLLLFNPQRGQHKVSQTCCVLRCLSPLYKRIDDLRFADRFTQQPGQQAAQGPIGQRLSIGRAACHRDLEPLRRIKIRQKLLQKARLACACWSHNRDQLWLLLRKGALPDQPKLRQAGLWAPQPRPPDLAQRPHLPETKDAQEVALAPYLHQARAMKEKRYLGRSRRPLAHENLAETGCLLQPGR